MSALQHSRRASRIETWPVERLKPYINNSRTHSAEQIAELVRSIERFGFNAPILVNEADGTILAGHARLEAALILGYKTVPVVPLDHLSEAERRAYIIADNKIAEHAGWDRAILAAEAQWLLTQDIDLADIGFTDSELALLLPADPAGSGHSEEVPDPQSRSITRPGDLWLIGDHRLLCGNARNPEDFDRLLGSDQLNAVVTSPPYAKQRGYDPDSGFEAPDPDHYVDWFEPVSASIAKHLAPDGSFFLNIKEHAFGGERSLYVKDLVIAHKRQWGWRFVDELCWTRHGLPGGWEGRFKNGFEPIFHFARSESTKFYVERVSSPSTQCFDHEHGEYFDGLARPSNVLTMAAETGQEMHSAAFPRPLVEFFALAFTDEGDTLADPFAGSGTTLAAAQVLGRRGMGLELSAAYCDVIVRRMMALAGIEPVLESTGQSFAAVGIERGVDLEELGNPKLKDQSRIVHRGVAPNYPARKKKTAKGKPQAA